MAAELVTCQLKQAPEFYDPIGQRVRLSFMGVVNLSCALGSLKLTNFLFGGDDKMTKMANFLPQMTIFTLKTTNFFLQNGGSFLKMTILSK